MSRRQLVLWPASLAPRHLLVLLLLLEVVPNARGELTIEPSRDAVEVNLDATFTCRHSNHQATGNNGMGLTWTFGNVTISSEEGGRVTAVQGKLTVRNATLADAGEYTCTVSESGPEEEEERRVVSLVVYVMPDYVLEWALVAGVALVLMLLLVALAAREAVKRRRDVKKLYREDKEKIVPTTRNKP